MDDLRKHDQGARRVGSRLGGGFLLVIALGFAGYAHTVGRMQASRDRERQAESIVNANISFARDVSLAARDTAADTQAYVFTGEHTYWENKWEADQTVGQALARLQDSIRRLPAPGLQEDAQALARAQEERRAPQEEAILRLVDAGRRDEARRVFVSRYVSTDDAFQISAERLVDRLEQYRQTTRVAETHDARRVALLGWAIQGGLLVISLLIALRLSRTTAAGLRREREAREALRRSEERFRQITENSNDIIRILDADGIVRYASPSLGAAFGYPPEEMIDTTPFDLIHPEDVAGARSMFAQLLATPDTPIRTEARYRHRNGSWRSLESVGRNLLHVPGIEGIVVNSRDVTDRKAMETQLAHQAFHDALTGLPNRALFVDRLAHALERARRRQDRIGVIFVDLDNFKFVNDSLGHQAGDQLLVAVAERLRECLRAGDTVARLGGDEFTLLVENINGIESLTEVADRVQELLRQPVLVQGKPLFVSASMGLVISGEDDLAPDDLLRDADIAMYQVKAKGKGSYTVFDRGMTGQAVERLEMENDLRHALDQGEFRLHYQPIISLETGVVSEVEALVRWEHPREGLIPPIRFIPLAEETGLIVPLGRWVLESACRQVQQWHTTSPHMPPLTVSVNLSARQLQQPDLVLDVARVLSETGLTPSCLKLEVTETVMVDNSADTLARLEALRDLGVHLAIDDFGTGYSSLSCLSNFPFGTLKIDRSFVSKMSEPDGMAIIEAIVTLARSLNLQVTGEGIETAEQLAQLRALSCHSGQGYHFSRPITGDALATFLGRTGRAQNDASDEAQAPPPDLQQAA